jgi:hypothetical protein
VISKKKNTFVDSLGTTKSEDQVDGGVIADVVVSQGIDIFKLSSSKD